MKPSFGLLFEVPAPSPNETEIEPIYDADKSLSFIRDENGELVPFISDVWMNGTQTITAVKQETTDKDPGSDSPPTRTQTVTKVRSESTDID